MKANAILAVAAAKLTRLLLHILGRGGTALPGKVALKFCPDLLRHLAKDVQCLVVTGTNGKTTSTRMLEQAFVNEGIRYFSNRSGSNLIQGITADFAANATITGKPKCKYAVIECDEAASKQVFAYMSPKVILVTNVFSDQLDRFGEITAVMENIKIGVQNAPNAVVCLNGDCSLTASIARDIPNKVVFYGVETQIYSKPVQEISDAPNCLFCGTAYEYGHVTYGHLGSFRCPNCGYSHPQLQAAVTKVLEQTADDTTVEMRLHGESRRVTINLPGGYNIYNAAGAVTALMEAGFTADTAAAAVENFECGFGRMEKFLLDGVPVRMILIKNTAGCNQVINFLTNLEGEALFSICLNDRIADGTDISWIWDANFEKLLEMGDRLTGVLLSGLRAEDMAQRMKHAGIPEEKLQIIPEYDALVKAMTTQDKPVFVMPSYTAMLELRDHISTKFGYKQFWK